MAAKTAAQVMKQQQRRKRMARRAARRRETPWQLSWQTVQFLICGGAFVLLVAAKLFSSDHAAPLRSALSGALERNMDVQAVFSAVGGVLAGEEDSPAERLYQAVFAPAGLDLPADPGEDPGEDSNAPAYQWTGDPQGEDALARLHQEAPPESPVPAPDTSETPLDPAAEAPPSPEEMETKPAPVLYNGKTLPEGVRMEQAILNFDYAAPVPGAVTSGFGYREHPTEGGERFHYGVDLAAAEGEEIHCFADGVVTTIGESSSYGKYCVVAHGGGAVSIYAHCSGITAASGQSVSRGEKIAEAGSTGQATGPHLHFELQQNGAYLNPIYYVAS